MHPKNERIRCSSLTACLRSGLPGEAAGVAKVTMSHESAHELSLGPARVAKPERLN